MGYSKWLESCDLEYMARWEPYIQHGGWIGEVQRRKGHGNAAGRVEEAMGKGLERGVRSDLEGCVITKDRHTITLCQSWRVGVISRCELDKQIDK